MAQKSLPITPGQKYKFVVKSAEEAAAPIPGSCTTPTEAASIRAKRSEVFWPRSTPPAR
jgi:1,4-alpha-glucan branching enzyme